MKLDKTKFVYEILGPRQFDNFFWASTLLIASTGFFFTGYQNFLDSSINSIISFPQSLLMIFYGFTGLIISFYLWLILYWNVGYGYNTFDKNTGIVRLFRKGFPGINRRLQLIGRLEDIQFVGLESNSNFLDSTPVVFIQFRPVTESSLATKIILMQSGELLTTQESEEHASLLASFLQVPLRDL